MKRRTLLLIVVLLGTAISPLSACSAPEDISLAGTSWVIVLETKEGEVESIIGPTEIHIDFGSASDGTVSGSYGWSKYEGTYAATGGTLTITDVHWTTMACQAEGGMDAEQQYVFALMRAESYAVDGDTLSIDCGEEVLVFGRG